MFNSKTKLPSDSNRTNFKDIYYKPKPKFFKNRKHKESENPEKKIKEHS